MKTNILHRIYFCLCAALCFACSEENLMDDTAQELVPLQLHTSSVTTRTSLLDDGTTVVWDDDDELAVYDYEATKHRFVADNVNGSSAHFVGKITAKKDYFLALYPYALGAESLTANQEMVVTLPQEQTAAAGSFAQNLNISVAKGARNVDGSPSNITFSNVCQLLKFTVPTYAAGKIKRIELNTESTIAGSLYVDYKADVPSVTVATDGSKSVAIVPPAGDETFKAGTYYIVSAPVQLQGFTMTFTCDDATYTLGSNSSFGGQAGKVYSLGSIDLVNTPKVTAIHQYANGALQGTSLTISNAPLGESAWNVVVKKADNTIVRTLQGTGTLVSSEQDANWPYLPKGNYTIEYTFTTSNAKQMTKTAAFSIIESPVFSVSLSAHTSYSYYVGDGVAKDIDMANECENNLIYSPTITINGISPRIFNNPNYTINTTTNIEGSLLKITDGVYTYANYAVGKNASYTLTSEVAFDGVSRTASKTVHITGLPYVATPPTQADWEGSAKEWSGSYVRLHKHTITKSFHCPADINVNILHSVRTFRAWNDWSEMIYKLLCGNTTLTTLKPGVNGTVEENNKAYETILKSSSPTISCVNSKGSDDGRISEGTNAKVKMISVEYR